MISGCIAGYEHAYSHDALVLPTMLILRAYWLPELTAQMFDKIIANAVDFDERSEIQELILRLRTSKLNLTISNTGPLLPEGNEVSVASVYGVGEKRNDVQNALHRTWARLYIANIIMTFHKGQLSLFNRKDSTGVVVSARFPLM